LKTSATTLKRLMLENRSDTENVRKECSTWLQTYEHFLNSFYELAILIGDKPEKNKLFKDHYDYDIFMINFKKEAEK
jgi:hypothetical protein